MSAFKWEECFVTGLTTVDEQHRHLVSVVNHFGELLIQPQEPTATELETIFRQLANYTLYHFQEEEKLMAQSRLDQQLIAAHCLEHERFIQEVGYMYQNMTGSQDKEARRLLRFLCDWLTYHILGSDQIMAGVILDRNDRSNEQSPAAHQKPRDPATDMLLQALDSLFKQMSERNVALFELNRSLEFRVAERTRELIEANRSLETLAMTDSLTGLPNRRQAMITFRLACQEAHAWVKPLSCMMIDADGFKTINDRHGHDAGDEVLRQLSHRLASAVRTDDHVYRLGGDEFLVLCLETPLNGALVLAEKIRSEVGNLCVQVADDVWQGSVSIGVAALDDPTQDLESLLKKADDGVYLAKRQGRNCVATVCHDAAGASLLR